MYQFLEKWKNDEYFVKYKKKEDFPTEKEYNKYWYSQERRNQDMDMLVKFQDDVRLEFPHPLLSDFLYLADEKGHSYGAHEVMLYCKEYVDILIKDPNFIAKNA
jgi:hypothetical protein